MKTAFSTLGCPKWSFSEIIATAVDLGFEGIEFRGVANEIYTPNVKEFSKDNLLKTKEKIKSLNLSVPVFTSGAVINDEDNNIKALKEAYDYIDLCSDFGSSYVRVLADRNPEPIGFVDEDEVINNLKKITSYAKRKNVNILIETNGCYSNSVKLLNLLKSVKTDNLFVIWDVHHTYRYANEKPIYTAEKLKDYIKHVHLKDSIIENGNVKYKLLGDGDVPVKEAVKSLKEIGYNGYLCLEWVKRWASDIDEPGIAFPNFIYFIKDLLNTL